MYKIKDTSSFRGILYGLYFLAPFFFLLLLSIGTRSTLAKICGGGGAGGSQTPPLRDFYGPVIVFPLEQEIRSYYLFITITTDISPA